MTNNIEISEEKLKNLLCLLLSDWQKLSDNQIQNLLKEEKQINSRLHSLYRSFPSELERILRYRQKKAELDKFSTKELLTKQKEMNETRARIMKNDLDDSLEDSFYEPAPLDSEENIIYELLEERAKITKTAFKICLKT